MEIIKNYHIELQEHYESFNLGFSICMKAPLIVIEFFFFSLMLYYIKSEIKP
jgi:hypothetical protein